DRGDQRVANADIAPRAQVLARVDHVAAADDEVVGIAGPERRGGRQRAAALALRRNSRRDRSLIVVPPVYVAACAARTLCASTRATCSASRPVPSPIWCRHDVPSATISVSGAALRTAGSSDSSPMASDASIVSAA